MVSFTPRPLYPQGKSSCYPLDRRLGGPQNRSGRGCTVRLVSSVFSSTCWHVQRCWHGCWAAKNLIKQHDVFLSKGRLCSVTIKKYFAFFCICAWARPQKYKFATPFLRKMCKMTWNLNSGMHTCVCVHRHTHSRL